MDKLKVLIVDDEVLIRNLLRMRLNWEEQGLTIVGEASHAREALELVELLQPDVIFTDIYMPSINGIELSGMVLRQYPHIKIVIVTGHDEFEYARQSVQLGIFDYILKPIRTQELLQVAEKLRRSIEEERRRSTELARLKEELERSLPFLREKFLNQWLTGALGPGELEEKAAYFGLPVLHGFSFRVAVLEIALAGGKVTEERLLLLQMECRKRAEAHFQGDADVLLASDARNQLVILAMNRDADFVCECERLQAELLEAFPCIVNIGIGGSHTDLLGVSAGYREAVRALQYQFITGNNQLVCFDDVVERGAQPYCANGDLLKELQFYVSVGASERALLLLRELFAVPFASRSDLRMAAMDAVTACQHAAIEQQIDSELVFHKETMLALLTAEHLPELKAAMERYVVQLTGMIHSKREVKEGNLVSRVRAYLEQQLNDPGLGLASTAAAFFISPGHLGRLLKKETGQTFVELLTQLRMKKAETLLKTTELKGYEVGERVGITDPHYFSILFKKTTGRSVNEYRSLRG